MGFSIPHSTPPPKNKSLRPSNFSSKRKKNNTLPFSTSPTPTMKAAPFTASWDVCTSRETVPYLSPPPPTKSRFFIPIPSIPHTPAPLFLLREPSFRRPSLLHTHQPRPGRELGKEKRKIKNKKNGEGEGRERRGEGKGHGEENLEEYPIKPNHREFPLPSPLHPKNPGSRIYISPPPPPSFPLWIKSLHASHKRFALPSTLPPFPLPLSLPLLSLPPLPFLPFPLSHPLSSPPPSASRLRS